MTDNILKTRNGLMIITAALGVLCLIVGLFFASSAVKWCIGIGIGVLICFFRVISMTKSVEKAVDMTPEDAQNYGKLQYMVRYVVTAAVAVLACYKGIADPFGLIVGLVLLQPAVYIYNFIESRINKANKANN